jgi:hypothetical protein
MSSFEQFWRKIRESSFISSQNLFPRKSLEPRFSRLIISYFFNQVLSSLMLFLVEGA